jgi:hypothetical protein
MLRFTTVMTGLAGAPYYSTQYSGGTTVGEAQPGVDALETFWTSLSGYITNGLVITSVPEVDLLDPATGLVTDTFPTTSWTFTSGGNAPLPKATQGLIRLRTSAFQAGRRIQGRIFIPALANDAQLGGVPSTPFMVSAQAAGDTLATDMSPAGDLVVWSRKAGLAANVSSTSPWNQFAVLRSRRD